MQLAVLLGTVCHGEHIARRARCLPPAAASAVLAVAAAAALPDNESNHGKDEYEAAEEDVGPLAEDLALELLLLLRVRFGRGLSL